MQVHTNTSHPPHTVSTYQQGILSCLKEKTIQCFAFVIGSTVGGTLGLVIPSGIIGLGAYLLDKFHFIDVHTNQVDLLDPISYMIIAGLIGLALGAKMGGLKGLSMASRLCHRE